MIDKSFIKYLQTFISVILLELAKKEFITELAEDLHKDSDSEGEDFQPYRKSPPGVKEETLEPVDKAELEPTIDTLGSVQDVSYYHKQFLDIWKKV